MHISVLDGLRGLAIIFVILYHYYPNYFHNGFLGVDIFFLLSGYLINFTQRNKSNSSVLLFLSKRIKRIYPLKMSVIYIITILNYFKPLEDYNMLYKEEFYSIISASNYFYIHLKRDYFLSQEINLLLHYWSLSVEEQFYIFYAFVYIIFYFKSKLCSDYIFIFDILFFILSIFFFISSYSISLSISFYTFRCRLWEFVVGIMIISFKINKYKKINTDYILFILLILSLLKRSYYYLHIIVIFLSFLVIYLGNSNDHILSLNILKYIGNVSYALYLVHYPIGIFCSKFRIIFSFVISIILFCVVEINPIVVKMKYTLIFIVYITLFICNYFIYKYITTINKVNNLNYQRESIIDVCSYDYIEKINSNRINILLLGDSHIQQYIRGFYDNENEIILYHYSLDSKKILNNNYKIESSIIRSRFNLVVISFSHFYFIGKYKIYQDNINGLLNYISNISSKFLLIIDNPRLYFNPNLFLKSKYFYGIENVNCSIIRNHQLQSNYTNNIQVYIYNINNFIVRKNMCILKYNNLVVYIDSNHLNSRFIEYYIRNDIHLFIKSNILHSLSWKSNKILQKVHYFTFLQSGNIYEATCKKYNKL